MTAADYLKYIVNEIHRTIVATVDDEGLPVTCAIDMMDCDENSLYFLTAKGKAFYDRLKKREYFAFTAMKGEDEKKKFEGAKPGDIITFNPKKAYPDNDAEVAALLKVH